MPRVCVPHGGQDITSVPQRGAGAGAAWLALERGCGCAPLSRWWASRLGGPPGGQQRLDGSWPLHAADLHRQARQHLLRGRLQVLQGPQVPGLDDEVGGCPPPPPPPAPPPPPPPPAPAPPLAPAHFSVAAQQTGRLMGVHDCWMRLEWSWQRLSQCAVTGGRRGGVSQRVLGGASRTAVWPRVLLQVSPDQRQPVLRRAHGDDQGGHARLALRLGLH